MINLLNSDDQIRIKIIRLVNTVAKPAMSVKEITQLLSVSEKTALNYILELSEEYPNHIQFDKVAKSLKVKVFSKRYENEYIRLYLRKSKSVSTLLNIALKLNISNKQRFDELSISESTFYRTINTLNENLKSSQICIKKENDFWGLVSNSESYIRKFISCLLIEIYDIKSITDFYPNLIIYRVLLSEYFKILSIDVDDISLNFFTTLFSVSLIRRSKEVSSSKIHLELMNNKLIMEFAKKYAKNSEYSTTDILFSLQEVMYYFMNTSGKNEVKCIKTFGHILNESLEFTLTQDQINYADIIIERLIFSYRIYPFKTSIFIDRIQDFVENLSTNHSTLVNRFGYALNSWLNQRDLELLLLNDVIYWMLVKYPNILSNWQGKIKLLVISDLGIEHLNFIKHFLTNKMYYSSKIEFILKSSNDVNKSDFISAEITLTNLTCYLDLPNTILIDDFPNTTQLTLINSLLLSIIENY